MPHPFDKKLQDHKYFKAHLRLAAAYHALPEELISHLYYDRGFASEDSFSVSNRHFARVSNMGECILAFPDGHSIRNQLLEKIHDANDNLTRFSLYNTFNAVKDRLSGIGQLRLLFNPPGVGFTFSAGFISTSAYDVTMTAALGAASPVGGFFTASIAAATAAVGLADTRPKIAHYRLTQLENAYARSRITEDTATPPLSIYQRWMFEPAEELGKKITELMTIINSYFIQNDKPASILSILSKSRILILLNDIFTGLNKLSLSSEEIQQLLNMSLTTAWHEDYHGEIGPRFFRLQESDPYTLNFLVGAIHNTREVYIKPLFIHPSYDLIYSKLSSSIDYTKAVAIYPDRNLLKYIEAQMLQVKLLFVTGSSPELTPDALHQAINPHNQPHANESTKIFTSSLVIYKAEAEGETLPNQYYYVNDCAFDSIFVKLNVRPLLLDSFEKAVEIASCRRMDTSFCWIHSSKIIAHITNDQEIRLGRTLKTLKSTERQKILDQIHVSSKERDLVSLTDLDSIKKIYQEISYESYLRMTLIDSLMGLFNPESSTNSVNRLKILMIMFRSLLLCGSQSIRTASTDYFNQAIERYPNPSLAVYLILKDLVEDGTETIFSREELSLKATNEWIKPLSDGLKHHILKDLLTNPDETVIQWLRTRPSAKTRIKEWIEFCQNQTDTPLSIHSEIAVIRDRSVLSKWSNNTSSIFGLSSASATAAAHHHHRITDNDEEKEQNGLL